ncbi:MAG: hypothetical protein HOH77_14980, partial [Candidatus Latescibacteria bacterium]|nr:hypothetical protein [Candidatus Latescibacterota bacterium]
NPVVALNIYGYSNCAYHATSFVSLCRAIGIPARVWEVWHHTVSEAYYNNAWHMLDSDIGLYYLTDDNKTIASVEQLWQDQKISEGLEEKAHLTTFSGRNKALRQVYTDAEGNNAYISQDGEQIRGYRYFHGPDFCYVQEDYDRFTYEPHTMAMTLRPGEILKRNWKGNDTFFDHKRHKNRYEQGNKEAIPIRYGNGQIIWRPNLMSELAPTFINKNQAPVFMIHDGQHPPLHVRNKQGGLYDFEERVIIKTETPYTIIGGKVKARLYRGAATMWDRLSFSIKSTTGALRKRIWTAPEDVTGSIDAEVDLDDALYPTGERGRHDHTLEFNFAANEKNDPPTQSGIESIEIVTDIQVAPNSLPALSHGKNVIRYQDETQGPHKVRITHIWREQIDTHAPQAPKTPVYPTNGQTISELAPDLKWEPAHEPSGDTIAQYCVRLSLDPQCRWPVATALEKELAGGATRWKLDTGWLNPDTTYYWRIKAMANNGGWGNWGEVFNFKTALNAK